MKRKFASFILICFLVLFSFCTKKNEGVKWVNLSADSILKLYFSSELINDSLFIEDKKTLASLYGNDNNNLIWFNGDAQIHPFAFELIEHTNNAISYGLDPEFYDNEVLKNLLAFYPNAPKILHSKIQFLSEILLSNLYLSFYQHLKIGWLRPIENLDSFNLERKDFLGSFLEDYPNGDFVDEVEHNYLHYKNYRKSIGDFFTKHQNIAPLDEVIDIEDSLKAVELCKNRLVDWQLLEADKKDNDVEFAKALKTFQYMFGVNSSGKLDSVTVDALNIPFSFLKKNAIIVTEKLKSVEQEHENFIMINIPTFTLFWAELGELAKTHKVILGTVRNHTPELTSTISKFFIYPEWNIPYSIATMEALPNIKRNISYLDKNHYSVMKSDRTLVDPNTVNWSRLNRGNFPYKLVQSPGRHNLLGLVKFHFNNSHSVYLHDTPSKRLFLNNYRSYSHGCMRLHDPFGFLKTILEFQEGVIHLPPESIKKRGLEASQKKFKEIIEGKENVAMIDTIYNYMEENKYATKAFNFKQRVHLSVEYYTSFYDSTMQTLFYRDLYKKDSVLYHQYDTYKSSKIGRKKTE
ncbi:MAG: L,D-transpeptidase family protein [Bacteroidales bacterium]|jgi:murein L,D-transpeptidase YcbB/YkuD|nr:L,D-transpeptidase family protein [Bacteroidales bacterium]